jgi:hypothetical protein
VERLNEGRYTVKMGGSGNTHAGYRSADGMIKKSGGECPATTQCGINISV